MAHFPTRRQFVFGAIGVGAFTVLTHSAGAAIPELSVGLQIGGTADWEIAAMQNLGLAKKYGVDLAIRNLADSAAGQVALLGGAVDVILSDLVWVAQQRGRGNFLYFVPSSLAVGGVLAGPQSGIETLAGLRGKTLGVGGGPLDKNLIFLEAYYQQQLGRPLLSNVARKFGAPSLIDQLLLSGRIDAASNFWQWNARAKQAGARPLVSVAQMLAAMGIASPPPLIGWAFSKPVADSKTHALIAFLNASFDTKQVLLKDDAAWESLKSIMGVGGDAGLFAALRQEYRQGILSHYDAADHADAAAAYALLARYGGPALVGNTPELPADLFWEGFRR